LYYTVIHCRLAFSYIFSISEVYLHIIVKKTEFPATPEDSTLSDMQRLLLIRTLRPDRYEAALRIYVDRNISDSVIEEVSDCNVSTFYPLRF